VCGLEIPGKQQVREIGMEKKKDACDVVRAEEHEALTEEDEALLDAVWDEISAGRATAPQNKAEGNGSGG